ncbi:DUF389 domain-containing protein [Chryseobacterium taklimakanense]|uniref:DUF389 domain-containing protein n=1 Tax=Chryseobacterium taklimakanense TaxID=536441 RepID=UPI000F5F585B|nr:DUF389 domain-containing protein [Chryseobacterium taklimakanense]AZI21874.1 DUF389 domain-containing protein [Chryseobacterium taklimakanense]
MPYSFKNTLRLPKEEEEKQTYAEIEEGVYFRGHNLWLLVLSMGIACVGLNINSPAAVIGAMLISPLMGPVVGLAFGLSIKDKGLIKLSLWNWTIMVLTGLLASTVYFVITPFHSETSQLAAFKDATVFDCFLALFGGFAWFLGITRKEAIKVIAGVAVATACIPPLCTAGYGLANLNWEYFLGGLYFYLINCVFIGVGTWILSIILGYQKYYLEKDNKMNRNASILVTVLSILAVLPSLFFTIKKWNDENLKQRADNYIKRIREKNPEIAILNYRVFENNNKKYLDITILNDSTFIPKDELLQHDQMIKDINLIWHYSKTARNNTDIEYLQNQINALRLQLENQKNQNIRIEKGKK